MARMTEAERKLRNADLLRGQLSAIVEPRKVVGLDLSYAEPGFASVERRPDGELITRTEVLKLSKVPKAGQRLEATARMAAGLILEAPAADLVVAEMPISSMNDGSLIFKAHGAVELMLQLVKWTGPWVTANGSQMKAFSVPGGGGNATTKAATVAVARELLGLEGFNDNEADALVAAHFGWALLLGRTLVPMRPGAMLTIDTMLSGKAPSAKQRREAMAA